MNVLDSIESFLIRLFSPVGHVWRQDDGLLNALNRVAPDGKIVASVWKRPMGSTWSAWPNDYTTKEEAMAFIEYRYP